MASKAGQPYGRAHRCDGWDPEDRERTASKTGLLRVVSQLSLAAALWGASAAGAAFEITIDATALSPQTIVVLGVTSGTTTAPLRLSLDPGTYTLRTAGTDIFFSLQDEGTLDYDADLDGFLSGRGTSTLVASGFPITIDATTLSLQLISILGSFNARFDFTSDTVTQLTLLPRTYFLRSAGTDLPFTLRNDGTLDYDVGFDGFLSGRGTLTLTISGYQVTFDASALSLQLISVLGSFNVRFDFASDTVTQLTLLPWTYFLRSAGADLLFTLKNDGTLDYDAGFDGFLSGRSTSTLTVSGYQATFDASALSLQLVSILGAFNARFDFTSDTVTRLTLLPRTYFFQAGGDSFTFTLDSGGLLWDFPENFQGLSVEGEGTSTLFFVPPTELSETSNVILPLVSDGELSVTPRDVIFPATSVSGVDLFVAAIDAIWTATDTTQLGAGWHISVIATDHLRGEDNPENHVILVGHNAAFTVSCSDDEIVIVSGTSQPPICPVGRQAIPVAGENPLTLLRAEFSQGMGIFEFAPNFELLVPGTSSIDVYRTELLIDIIAGP